MRKNHAGRLAIGRATGALLLLGLFFVVSSWADEEVAEQPASPGSLEFVGHNLFGDANGTFHSWRISEKAVDAGALGDSHVVVEIDLASLDTGIERRDDHLRNPDFFEVETYPVARVRVHSPLSSGQNASGQSTFTAQFDVDLHGVQKTLEGEITLVGVDPLVFEGSLVLDRTDFGVGAPPSRWNPMSVGAAIPVSFRVEL